MVPLPSLCVAASFVFSLFPMWRLLLPSADSRRCKWTGDAIFRINWSPCDQKYTSLRLLVSPFQQRNVLFLISALCFSPFLPLSVTLITAHLVVVCLLDVSRICHSPNCCYYYCCCCSNCRSACTTLRLCHTLDGSFALEQRRLMVCCICAHPKERKIAPLKAEEKKNALKWRARHLFVAAMAHACVSIRTSSVMTNTKRRRRTKNKRHNDSCVNVRICDDRHTGDMKP